MKQAAAAGAAAWKCYLPEAFAGGPGSSPSCRHLRHWTAGSTNSRPMTGPGWAWPSSAPGRVPEQAPAQTQARPASVRGLRCGGRLLLCRTLRGAGLLGGFLRRGRLRLLGSLLGGFLRGFLRRLLGLLRRLLGRFLRGFLLRRHKTLLGLFGLLATLLLFAFSHRDPPVAADQCLSSVSSRPPQAQGPTISSIPAGDRLSPNREAQPCAPQELTCRRQSAPCIQYCPQQSCPA